MPGTDARRSVALIALLFLFAAAPAAHAAAGDVDLVSRANGASGVSGDGASQQPQTTQDGHLVAFTSAAHNLTADTVPAGKTQAFVRNLAANTTVLASRAANGDAANDNVVAAAVSDDGRYVVFQTRATNLGPTAAGVDRVFLRDLTAGTTTLVAENAVNPALAGDGSTVAFCTNANIAGTGAAGASRKVYAYTVATGAVQLVSRQDGAGGGTLTGDTPSLSRDGNVVAFAGQGGTAQVWVRDRARGTTVLASRASGAQGAQAGAAAIEPAISGNGRYVVFRTSATNLSDDDVDTSDDIFERDLQENTTTLASRADGPTGAGGAGDSDLPSVSDDGSRVFFRSRSANLSSEDNSGGDNGFVRDMVNGTTTWVHGAPHQSPAPQGVMDGLALSGDGRYAVFASGATLLPAQETGAHGDVFRRDLGGAPTPPPPPVASIGADQGVDEGGSGADTPLSFKVTLSAPDPRAIQLDWSTVAGSATAGADFRAASGQVSFAPGQTEAFISVDVLGDANDEPDETFSVTLSNPVNVTLARATATVTIRDDDLPPVVVPPPGVIVPPPPAGLPATSGTPATTCPTQTVQGLAVLRGCIANGRMTGVVSLNGLTIDLGGNALVVEADRIASTGAVTISAGDVVLNRGVNFTVDPKSGLGSLTAPSGTSLYGLTLQPKLALRLATGGVANLEGQATLPFGGTPLNLSFQTSDADGLRRSTLKAAASVADFGKFVAAALSFTFDPGAQVWRGGLTAQTVFPGVPSLKLSGTINRAGVTALTGSPSSLGGLIHLRTATLSLLPSPLTLKGTLGFDVGSLGTFNLFSFDGTATYVLGAKTLQFSGVTKLFGLTLGTPITWPSLGFAGLLGPGLGSVAAANIADTFTVGGSAPLTFGTGANNQTPPAPPPADLGKILGGVGGTIGGLGFGLNPFSGDFSGAGDGTFKVLGVTIGGQAAASQKGFAACGQLGFLHFGLGVTFKPLDISLMGGNCDVAPWRASASAAQAGSKTLRLPAGVQVLRIHSTAPATLHGPGGRTVSTATAPQTGATAIVLKDGQYTYVALKNAKGTWTVDGAGAIDSAAQLAPAKVTAKVAKGRVRWTERVNSGQSVTLAEQGAGVYRELGTLHGAKGSLKLKPQGSGPRTILAIVNQGGVPVSRKAVAHYTAPKPPKLGRPGKVTVNFAKARLSVSWKAAKHAASYLVKAKTPNGTLLAATRKRAVKLTDILAVTKATVTVTPVSATGVRGPARTLSARLRR